MSWGPEGARRLRLILVGVDGHHALAGSRVVQALLHAHAPAEPRRTVAIHGVDPWACERGAPTTRDGVVLDRNFIDFDAGLPDNPEYASVHAPLVYTHLDGAVRREADAALADRRAALEVSGASLFDVIDRGQYRFADGLGFGGQRPAAARGALDPFSSELLHHLLDARPDELEILTIRSDGARWGRIDVSAGAPAGSFARWLAGFGAPARVRTATLHVGTFGPDAALERLRDEAIVRLGSDRHRCPDGRELVRTRTREHFAPRDPAWRARLDASASGFA